jgi:hypothetical protein
MPFFKGTLENRLKQQGQGTLDQMPLVVHCHKVALAFNPFNVLAM